MYRRQCLRDMGELQKAQRLWEDFLRIRPQSALADDTLLALGDLDFEDLDQPRKRKRHINVWWRTSRWANWLGKPNTARSGVVSARLMHRAKEIFIAEQTALGGPNPNAPPTELGPVDHCVHQ